MTMFIEGMFSERCDQNDQTATIPDIIEFCTSDVYINKPSLYPRQATLLKVIFLQTELFTQYDYDVIGEWQQGFHLPDPERMASMSYDDRLRYEGNNGISPDVLDRIEMLRTCEKCKHDIADHSDRYNHCMTCGKNADNVNICSRYRGYRWFREVDAVIGRRGSKGHLGGLCGSYVLWHFIKKGDPQDRYGVDRNKVLACFVYAAKKDQAKVNQWADLKNVITDGPCFSDYIPQGMPTAEMLKVRSPHDKTREDELRGRGITMAPDPTFQIVPKESTMTSGRGPASFMQYYDEMAHVVREVASATAEEVYGAATPALDQFGKDAFIYAGSSPWQMMGQFYENYENALSIDHETGKPTYPEMLTVQLTSWDPYIDWDRSHTIGRAPADQSVIWRRNESEGEIPISKYHFVDAVPKCFPSFDHPIQAYDDAMRRLERANPETFAVERRCLDPDTKVLCSDLTWRPIKDLGEGDELVAVDEHAVDGKQRKMRTATVVAKWTNRDQAYRITFEDGTSVICSASHRWLSGPASSPTSFRWRHLRAAPNDPGPREIIKVGDSIRHLVDPWEEDCSWESGYLAGVYDGEGTAIGYPRREFRISFVQNPGEVLDATLAYLKEKGYEPRHMPGARRCQTYVIQGLANCMRFIGQTGAHKLRRQAVPAMWEGRAMGRKQGLSSHKIIASIEELPEQDLIDIETSTGTFIAEGFVSHNSHWATAQDAYLNPHKVDEIFGKAWDGRVLHMQTHGILSMIYAAHGDPSKTNDNFGFAIGHVEGPDPRGLIHVVFDLLHVWRPMDFEPDEHGLSMVDYFKIGEDIKVHLRNFLPSEVSFDQFNSVSTIQALRTFVMTEQLPKRIDIFERTATRQLNWTMAEVFKAATNMGLVHAPDHELAKLELKFLQEKNGRVDHPSSGPVQSKDVADCMIDVVYSLIGDQMAAFLKDMMGKLSPGMSVQGGTMATQQRQQEQPGFDAHRAMSGVRGTMGTGMGARGRQVPSSKPRPQRGMMPGVRRGRPGR